MNALGDSDCCEEYEEDEEWQMVVVPAEVKFLL